MKLYNIFLDDERNPRDVMAYRPNPAYVSQAWDVVHNYDQFLQKVSERYADGFVPAIISLDHDLVNEHYRIGALSGFQQFDENAVKTPTGWHCLKWFLKFCDTSDLKLPQILLHSKNDAGVRNMNALIDEYIIYKNGRG